VWFALVSLELDFFFGQDPGETAAAHQRSPYRQLLIGQASLIRPAGPQKILDEDAVGGTAAESDQNKISSTSIWN
jgi:hypothetical protein